MRDMSRAYFCSVAETLATPILRAAASRELKARFPLEHNDTKRHAITCFEAFARVLVGLAPWFELDVDDEAKNLAHLARQGLDSISNPESIDAITFHETKQSLVESAFLSQALLRAPNALWYPLSDDVKRNLLNGLKSTRVITPHNNNWILFPSMIEVFLLFAGEKVDNKRLMVGIEKYDKWYMGDGMYGDGPELHFDYYNSYVIHPMIIEILDAIRHKNIALQKMARNEYTRLQCWAIAQERMVSPDGTFPPVGRSLTYRCGAFQGLALCAFRHGLPDSLPPARVRIALARVIQSTLGVPGTFDENGWLTIGVCGNQPIMGESYITRGSVYLCSTALLPLGLPPQDPFWKDATQLSSWERIWKKSPQNTT